MSGAQFVGVFSVTGDQMMVSDPCYDKGTWCQAILTVKEGPWAAYIVKGDVEGWGVRVKELTAFSVGIKEVGTPFLEDLSTDESIFHKYSSSQHWKDKEVTVGADSGQVGFFSLPTYKLDTRSWLAAAFEATSPGCSAGLMGGPSANGVVSSSGFGDGSYVCEVLKECGVVEDSPAIGIRVRFINGDGEEESLSEEEERERSGDGPQYQHDCEHCKYLGKYQVHQIPKKPKGSKHSHKDPVVLYDLYYCGVHEKNYRNTVVCRYGDEPSEYSSGMPFAEQGIEPYAEARRKAITKGFYNPAEMK